MSPDKTKDKVVEILTKVQSQLCPQEKPESPMTGETLPAIDIEKFDSKIWPLAKARIARELEIVFDAKERLFVRDKGVPVSIDEVVNRVCILTKLRDAKLDKCDVA